MSLITELSELLGFHKSYIDSFGNEVIANETALTKLITAMGFDIGTDTLILSHIQTLKEKPWREVIPPVHIQPVESHIRNITICLQSLESARKNNVIDDITINITTEDGIEHIEHIELSQLQVVETKELSGQKFTKYQLSLPDLQMGYHELSLTYRAKTYYCFLIYTPQMAYNIKQASPKKTWGISTQLYSIKSEENWGMGDFFDLKNLVSIAAKQNISTIGLNPLHALYSSNPKHCSPYSPSSRSFLNTLYINPEQTVLFSNSEAAQTEVKSPEFQDKKTQIKSSEFIDYAGVHALKNQILTILFKELKNDKNAQQYDAFCQYKTEQGPSLTQQATYEALYAYFQQTNNNAYSWLDWPAPYHKYESNEVKAFQQNNADRIEYFAFLQWLAHIQLSEAKDLSATLGMSVGLYLDLAVGCDGGGAEVWANQSTYLSGASVGAPPDQMNLLGQNWGLTPINPSELIEQKFQPLIKALRHSMQYAGALRIDHILGLKRQYWVAPGMEADEGIFISFPFDDILSVIALESQRNKCVVIGEDLGTVPEGFTEHIQRAGLLSYKVLYFERWWDTGLFKRPDTYPEQSMATASTHDLPTVAGWWTGTDLAWREKLDLYPRQEMAQEEQKARADDRNYLLAALVDADLLNNSQKPSITSVETNEFFSLAVQEYLANSASHLHLIQVEDCIELLEQVNIPGTIDEHPNWSRKLPLIQTDIWSSSLVESIISAMQKIRP